MIFLDGVGGKRYFGRKIIFSFSPMIIKAENLLFRTLLILSSKVPVCQEFCNKLTNLREDLKTLSTLRRQGGPEAKKFF